MKMFVRRLKFPESLVRLLTSAATVLAVVPGVHAEILGPYTPDPDTLHLWHMNETTARVVDAAPYGTDVTALENGATLGNECYSRVNGLRTSLGTYTGNTATRPRSVWQ